MPGFAIDPAAVVTNIVIADVDPPDSTGERLAALRAHGVLAGTLGRGRIRFVTHRDVDDAGLDRAIGALQAAFGARPL
jgi:threonine aldolase